MNTDDIVSTLNDLIETCKDGEEGFRTCAEDVMGLQFKQMFTTRSQRCASAARELQELVRSLGGDPEQHSSLGATLHRRWVDIKSAILGKDNEAVLNECERGEDMALRSYRNALAKELPTPIRLVVERQYEGVVQNHQEVKTLRDQAKVHG
jgi:uncharacterized protein (TIGR02284 family)